MYLHSQTPVTGHNILNTVIASTSLEPSDEPGLNDNNSDSGTEQDALSKTPRDSDRHRAQNAKFLAWLSQRAQKITKDEVQAIVENAKEETLSTRSLMAKQETDVIITSPREYQLELFERAKVQNIIAVLDTGQYLLRCCGRSLFT